MNFNRAVIAFAVIGVMVLYLVSLIAQPHIAQLDALHRYENQDVVCGGIVVAKRATNAGNTILKLRDGNITATVFVRDKVEVEVGDTVIVEGRVSRYRDEYELIAPSAAAIHILRRWDADHILIGALGSAPERYEDMNVNVTGYATYVGYHEFYLVDNLTDWSHYIKVVLRKATHHPMNGQFVCVKGQFVYDACSFSYLIKVETQVHEVGYVD